MLEPQQRDALLREKLKLTRALLVEDERERLSISLRDYVTEAWNVLEPGREFVSNWHIDIICEYLQAIGDGQLHRLVVNIPFRCMKPVSVDMRVLCETGEQKRLGDVIVGDLVLTHRGRFREVEAVHEQGELPCLKIKTDAGREIVAAPDHPFLTPNGWVPAEDLVINDILGVPIPDDHGLSNRSDDEFVMAGYFVGDGCTAKSSPHGFFANITTADPEIAKDLTERSNRLGWSVKESVKPLQEGKPNSARVYHISKGVRPWIKEIGLARKTSHTKRVPEFVFTADKWQIGLFLGAYFACDGTACPRKKDDNGPWTVEWTSVSRGLLRDLQQLLVRLGVKTRIRKRIHNKNPWVPAGYVFWNLCVSSGDDAQRFRDRVSHIGSKALKLKRMPVKRRDFDPILFADKIVDIQDDGVAECRCLTVAEDHSFTVEDIAVHNSLLVGVFWPTWMWTHEPQHQFLTLSHAEKLAVRDALKSRRLMRSDWYQERWHGQFEFTGDQNEKSRYENNKNGHRIALGIKAGVTGEGGDTVIIDDPHDADKAQSDVEREGVLDSYDHKIISRLNNQVTGNIVLIMQRLHQKDLAGHVIAEEAETFEQLILPMEYDGPRYVSSLGLSDPRTEIGECLEPIRFPPDVIKRLKKQLGSYGAGGQLQQRPSPSEGGILKKTWWRKWPTGKPWPKCDYVLQSYDTAFSGDDFKMNARSARTTWGVFYDEIVGDIEREYGSSTLGEGGLGGEGFGIILLEAWADHVEYPELRKEGLKAYKAWKPDAVLIEKKASGQSLIQDMRKAGIPVLQYNPDRDKVSRAYSVQALLEGGLIFTPDRKWAEEVIEECGMFPNGEFADFVDTCTQAWIRLRSLHLIEHPDDDQDDDEDDDNERDNQREAAYG